MNMREIINLVEAKRQQIRSSGIYYHGSPDLFDITGANSLTHFGTREAAEHRVKAKTGHGYLYPVKLAINNPLMIRDATDFQHSPFKLVDMLYYNIKAITKDERAELQAAQCSSDSIVAVLSRKGYDGFVYKNIVEDPGHISWMIFSADQVEPAGEPIKI